jgi:cobalt-zinc-cadmium efflux system protein
VTGWLWVDPATSLLIVAVIVWGTWGLLSESTAMSMAAVPSTIDPTAVRFYLVALPGVVSIHDLHIWSMSTTETALTAHLVMPAGNPGDAFLIETCRQLSDRFKIGHATLQIENATIARCTLEPDHVV